MPARPCLAPLLSLHPLRSLYSCALAPPGLPSLSAHCLLSIALPQARSFPGSISTASFLAPSLFPTPDGPIPPPSGHSRVYSAVALSGAAPLLRTSSPASSLTFFCTPPPIFTLFPIWLVCFAPNHFPLGSLFPSLLPPPICFVHVHFPSGAGAGRACATGREPVPRLEGMGLGRGALEELCTQRRGGGLPPRERSGVRFPEGWGPPRNPGTRLHLSAGAGGAGPAFYLPLAGEGRKALP